MNMVIVPDDRDVLPTDYILQSYKLSTIIGRGSYGITYLAKDTYLNRKVAIKEYLPREYATRNEDFSVSPISDNQKEMFEWGLNNFLLEARTLAKFNHRNIIKVIGVAEKNNTAYMIMEFEEGSDLSNVYRRVTKLSEQQLLHYFVPIIEGLSVVHKLGFIHRDIKPSNIYVRNDTSTVLLDFGSARQTVENDDDVLTTLVTAGFAPYEQYHQSKYDQGPWSDIYSLGATLYYCITGNKPADALLRGSSLLKNMPDPYIPVRQCAKNDYSDNFLLAIDHALSFNIDERPNNALMWSKMLSGIESAKSFPNNKVHNQKPEFYPRTVPMESSFLTPMNVVVASASKNEAKQSKNGIFRTVITNIGRRVRRIATTIVEIFAYSINLIKTIFSKLISKLEITNPPLPIKIILSLAIIITPVAFTIYPHIQDDIHTDANISELKITENITPKINNIQTTTPPTAKTSPTAKNNEKIIVSSKVNNATPTPSAVTTIKPEAPKTTGDILTEKNNSNSQKLKRQEVVEFAEQVVIKDLFRKAELAFEQKRYSVPAKDNAIYHYKKILGLQPDNPKAKAGLKFIESRYVDIVEKFIKSHNWKIAQKNIDKIAALSTKNSAVIGKLSTQLNNEKRKVEQTDIALNQANKLYNKSRLTRPEKENALNYYKQALKLDPDNDQAQAGIEKIFDRLSIVLDKQIVAKRIKKARRTFEVLKSINSDAPIISNTISIITELEIEHKKIQRLISAAEKDFIHNRISLPKSNNALSKYNAVLDIDENNNQAKAGIKQIFTYYVSTYYRQIDNNKFSKAEKILKTLKNIGYSKKKLTTLKKFAKLEKKTRINTEIIQGLLSKIENGLSSRNLYMLEQISVFKTKKRKYIVDLMKSYSDYSVNITNKKYSKKRNRTTARVVLSSLEASDDDLFDPPDNIKISIKVLKDKSKKWKVYW